MSWGQKKIHPQKAGGSQRGLERRSRKKRVVINVLFIPFFVFGDFWQQSYENTKILCNLCLHFARQDGQDRKKRKENHTI